MTSSEAITQIMHDHITGIRQDAAKIRTQERTGSQLQEENRYPARPDRHPTGRAGRIHPDGMRRCDGASASSLAGRNQQ